MTTLDHIKQALTDKGYKYVSILDKLGYDIRVTYEKIEE